MPRRKPADDGHETNRNARDAGDAPARRSGLLGSVSDLQTISDRYDAASLAFQIILAREDGWLRVVGGDLAKANYWKFKFSSGLHKGKYVMYVCAPGDWTEGLIGLFDKLTAVDEGRLKPAHDTFYDPR